MSCLWAALWRVSTQLTLDSNSLLALNQLQVGQPVNALNEPVYLIETTIAAIDYVNGILTLNTPSLYDLPDLTFVAQRFPKPLSSLFLTLNPLGQLSLFANRFAMNIPPGPHTLLATTIPFRA